MIILRIHKCFLYNVKAKILSFYTILFFPIISTFKIIYAKVSRAYTYKFFPSKDWVITESSADADTHHEGNNEVIDEYLRRIRDGCLIILLEPRVNYRNFSFMYTRRMVCQRLLRPIIEIAALRLTSHMATRKLAEGETLYNV